MEKVFWYAVLAVWGLSFVSLLGGLIAGRFTNVGHRWLVGGDKRPRSRDIVAAE